MNEVAAMPTRHSWAAKIMEQPSEKMDELTEQVDLWIIEEMEKKHPQSDQADRIVREVWPLVMEKEAIAAYLEKNPMMRSKLPTVSPSEAAAIGAMGVQASQADEAAAREFLQAMQAGTLVPPLSLN